MAEGRGRNQEGKSNGENKYEAGLKSYDRLQKLSIELVTFRTACFFLSNVHVERIRTVQEEAPCGVEAWS